MVLNYIWIAFFLIAFVFALVQWIFMGDMEIFPALTQATFDNAKLGFEISLWLTGVMSLWLGIMKIGEKGGMVAILAKITSPLFSRLFPEVPKNHPAMGAMLMNISANMLGLDNAATPLGLKAMHSLQELNPVKDTASNAQIMFLVLNTSGLTIIPISIMVYRSQLGAADPSDVFIPILLTTFFSTLSGLIAVSLVQRINLFHKNVLFSLGLLSLVIASIIWFFSSLSQSEIGPISSNIANFILFSIIIAFIVLAVRKKVNVYDSFVEGAKEGFSYAVMIIPYLIAILVAVGVFRASGAMMVLKDGLEAVVAFAGLNTDFVPSIPTALMKPLSGSGARGMMVDAMEVHGADSFVGRLVSVMQGSTETTFYVLAVYFGSVNIRNSRYALTCGLIADAVGIIAAILISYMFFY
ncbi:membrane protein [Marivirga tractuosa]|uniref:Nucleoside recognition domain protein n=1 Tax=Marivirga tractuosa (strain ATCC 23168 / DSM 4126 / NBRC 15989 / NCIMB 1408 / VKM B-1430 / H-43) TaxID=643867 RepID=E4TP20_MARTH|nr:spore maturation protein [Marivirga tractuosa]ADR23554.1 nucleoside recognition domain protein [Marivirga tractuosa DSM 4126]BDD15767.1 membrane protein [Marivirga tractuosa]